MISKAEVTAMSTQSDEVAFEEAERRVDSAIKISNGGTSWVDLRGIKGLTEGVQRRLVEAYTMGGWSVRWDEPYLVLS